MNLDDIPCTIKCTFKTLKFEYYFIQKTLTKVYLTKDAHMCINTLQLPQDMFLFKFPKYYQYPQKLINTKNVKENWEDELKLAF